MQTIAHNTVVVDEASQFGGNEDRAEEHHPEKYFSVLNGEVQVVSAKENAAYKGIAQHRTLLLVQDKNSDQPMVVDVFRISSATPHQYDLPFWYQGHLIETSFPYTPSLSNMQALGNKNGYQHIWKEAYGKSEQSTGSLTFLNGSSFYSITTNADRETEFFLGRSGANDPNFNLRRETCLIVRKKGDRQLFVSVIEPHGTFNPLSEASSGSKASVKDIEVLKDDDQYTAVQIRFHHQNNWVVLLANNNAATSAQHEVTIAGKKHAWTGPYLLMKTK